MLEKIQNYRTRKNKLSKLSTEKLKEMRREMSLGRMKFGEDIGDTFFEAPAIDSDERIVSEILKERNVII